MAPAPAKFQPALFGGLFMGVLSALPFINLGNCCCLWVIGGGLLATYLMQQNHPYPVSSADGALVGLMAGLIGGLLGAVLSIPMMMLMGGVQHQVVERILSRNPDIPPQTREMLERMTVGAAAFAVKLIFSVCIGLVFGMLGGLLGVALFKKKDLPPGTTEVLPPPTTL